MNSYIPYYMRGENLDKDLDYDRTIALPPSELSDYFIMALDEAEMVIFSFDLNPKQIVKIYKSLSQIWNFREHYVIRIKQLKHLFEWCLRQNIQDDESDSWKDFMESIYILYAQMCKAYHIRPEFKYQLTDYNRRDDYDWYRDPQRCKTVIGDDEQIGRYVYDEI